MTLAEQALAKIQAGTGTPDPRAFGYSFDDGTAIARSIVDGKASGPWYVVAALATRRTLQVEVTAEDPGHAVSIDENGVATWVSNGRAIAGDTVKEYAIDQMPLFDGFATEQARQDQVEASIASYVERRAKAGYSSEELFEMRAAFGAGTVVVDALSGLKISL